MIFRKPIQAWVTCCLSTLFPILYFCSANYRFVTGKDIGAITALSLICVLILYFILNKFIHVPVKSALMVTFTSLYFFSYGHLRIFLLQSDTIFKKQYILFPLTFLLFCVLIWQINRVKHISPKFLQILNLMFIALAVFSGSELLGKVIQARQISETKTNKPLAVEPAPAGSSPDLYIIVVDEYARQDELLNIAHFDNSNFINQLEALGFVVPACSRSNYYWSIQSMSSMLNLDYINDTTQKPGTEIHTSLVYDQVINDLKHSLIRTELETRGYKTIAFETGFPWSEVTDADTFYRAEKDIRQVTPFTTAFLETTLVSISNPIKALLFSQSGGDELDPFSTNSPEFYYSIKMNAFNRLDQIPELPGPKFVFAHVLSTHKPYVWDEKGIFSASIKDTPANYARQIPYNNERIIHNVEGILANSKNPPIIVLLSDHGYRTPENPREQGFNNFIAVYAPENIRNQIYPSITPVNLFRILYNGLFDANYPLLSDDQFDSTGEDDNTTFIQVEGYCPK